MPNPKTGTVTMEIGAAVKASKAGKIDFKVDKTGIVHTGIGKASFTAQQLYENAAEVLNAIAKLKPQALKGTYMKSAALCSTMSPGVKIDLKAFLSKGAE
jgi:large subunit ribosomal protein L1